MRRPGVDVKVFFAFAVVWLVHDAEDDAWLGFPVRGDLGPSFGEDVCVGAVLTDDAAPPAAVVVDVDASKEVRGLLTSYIDGKPCSD